MELRKIKGNCCVEYGAKLELPLMTNDQITDKERKKLRDEAQEYVKDYETTFSCGLSLEIGGAI